MKKQLEKIDLSNVSEIKLDKTIQNFLERRNYENFDIQQMEIEENNDIEFIKISHISYDRSRDESDLHLIDFQQILSAISSYSGKFVYRIEGTLDGINLYLGTTSSKFLQDSFEGIYSGSKSIKEKPKQKIYTHTKAMLGIPALKRDSDKSFKQSLERILFPMQRKEFRITLIAESYQLETIQEIISSYQSLGDELHKFTKQTKNIQKSISEQEGSSYSNSETNGTSDTTGTNKGKMKQSIVDRTPDALIGGGAALGAYGLGVTIPALSTVGNTIGGFVGAGWAATLAGNTAGAVGTVATVAGTGANVGGGIIAAAGTAGAVTGVVMGPAIISALAIGAGVIALKSMMGGKSSSEGTSESKTRTNSTSTTNSTNSSTTESNTLGITFDEINKSAQFCEEMIDKHIERFQKGLNHGMWNSTLYIESDDTITLNELEHTLKSVYSGDETFYEPIRFTTNNIMDNINFNMEKLPNLYMDSKILSHPTHSSFSGYSTAINTEELSLLTALPSNDIDGVSVSKVSSFGLTQSLNNKDSINIGNILNKKKKTTQRFFLSKEALNSHVFVSGITGSGKSNTIKLILEKIYTDEKIPFLVIEPAKSEYKHLLNDIKDLQVFRPGAKDDIFKFNPFVFEYTDDENTTTLIQHVDMLKTTFSSAFPMYGPMPYILEEAIHKIYEDKGWNFDTQHHSAYTFSKDANYERKSMLFPTMNDLRNTIESVVENAGYADELNSNIKAALKTRINNLTIGTKGKIFNSKHCFSDEILFDKPTIIELSNIIDDEEKSFLMGLILNKLYRYRILKGTSQNKLKHITVIEEAHRLLPNVSTSNNQESSDTKAKAVETFTNILAEIRSLGEGIIVVDQIASKLHQDVIKNTNVKILHRTMAKDDRDIIGNSINLTEDQILDIAELKTGEAIVHNKDVHQAFMVTIDEKSEKKLLDDNSEVKTFYNKFINLNEQYKYEFMGEKGFYKENYRPNLINTEIINNLRIDFNKFINALFSQDTGSIIDTWHIIYDKLSQKEKEFKEYQFLLLWQNTNYFGNHNNYSDIEEYLKTTKSFSKIITSMPNFSVENIDKFINKFEHENLKLLYPSLKDYNEEDLNYTLLILENMLNNLIVIDDEELSLNEQVDNILKSFKISNPLLFKKSFIATRLGQKDLSIDNIIEEDI